MLVLTRKPRETIIAGDITITICKVMGTRVRVGIEAPASVTISRGENQGGGGTDADLGRDAQQGGEGCA